MDMLEVIKDKFNQYGLTQITVHDVQWLIENLEYNRNRKDEVLLESGKQWSKLFNIRQILDEK